MSSENEEDYIPKQSRKRCEFLDSGDELGEEGEEGSPSESTSLETYSKGKRKRSFIASGSDDSDDDNESSNDNFNSKNKNKGRRGIIYTDSESDDDSDESSSSEREEESDNLCPICLGEFKNQMVGIPENCQHIFCMECIKEWSKNVNNCPVDRKKFNRIRVKDSNGNLVEEIVIKDVKMNDQYEDPPTYCQICNQCDREGSMLLCDECDNGYHMDCLTPPLECVPIDQWFCIECAPQPPPKKKRSRSSYQNDDFFIADESFLDDLHDRVEGESSRTNRARTVASTRTAVGQRRSQRGSSPSEREQRNELRGYRQVRRPSKPKTKKTTASKSRKRKRRVSRKKTKKNMVKKKINSELQKVRKKMANEEEFVRPPKVSLFGDPFYLDELYDPGEEEKVESPVRSTIVNTPDVVGAILAIDSLYQKNVSVSRDGRGTLIPKVAKSTHVKPVLDKVDRKRTITFNMPSDNDDDGENKDDNACDIIGSILSASDILNPDKEEFPITDKIKIKEEPIEWEQSFHENKRRVNRIADNRSEGGDDDSNSDDNAKNNIGDEKGTEEKGCIDDEVSAVGVKIKVEESFEYTSWETDKKKETGHIDVCKKTKEIKVKTEPVDEEYSCKKKEEDNGEKNKLLIHMRNRLKETMEKKTKAEKIEEECKQMRGASETIGYKTDGSLLNVASFKIPKLKKEKASTDTDKHTEDNKDKNEKKNNKENKDNNEKKKNKENKDNKDNKDNTDNKRYSITFNTDNYPCNSRLKEEVLSSGHQEGNIAKGGVKKRPPSTMLEKKIKLYNEGVVKPTKKQLKDVSKRHRENYEKEKKKKKKEKYGEEESNEKKHRNEKYSKPSSKLSTPEVKSNIGEQTQNEGDMKKTSISLKDYRNRHLCEDLFGDANLGDDLEDFSTKQGDSTSKDKTTSDTANCTDISASPLNNIQVKEHVDKKGILSRTSSGNASSNDQNDDTETKMKSNIKKVDLYSKYINPSRNLYNDNETALTVRTSTYYAPTNSTCVKFNLSKPSSIDLNDSIPQCEEAITYGWPLHTDVVPFAREEFYTNIIDTYNDIPNDIIPDVSEEQTESDVPALKFKADLCKEKADTLKVKDDVATPQMSTMCEEEKSSKLKKDMSNNQSSSVSLERSKSSLLKVKKDTEISKVPERKCESSTSFEIKGNVIDENVGIYKEQCKSNSLKSKNDILSTSASSYLSTEESNSLKLKKNAVVGHADSVVCKDQSKFRPRNDTMTYSTSRLYKEQGKQNTESKKALDTRVVPHLSKERDKSISLQNTNYIVNRPVSSVYTEQGRSNSLELKSGTCKGRSKLNKDIETCSSSRACGEQGKSNTTRLKTDKLSVISKEQHKSNTLALKTDIDYRKCSTLRKFEKNSPYSVVRPFTQSSNLLTNRTPVAVISPSFRGDTPEPSFKFKEVKTNELPVHTSLKSKNMPISSIHKSLKSNNMPISTIHTSLKSNNMPISSIHTSLKSNNMPISSVDTSLESNNTPISDHHLFQTSAWVLNTSTITARKRNCSAFTKTNSAVHVKTVSSCEPAIDTMTNTEKNIIFNRRIGEEIKHSWKAKEVPKEVPKVPKEVPKVPKEVPKVPKQVLPNVPNYQRYLGPKELDEDTIDKIKAYLKPYYKKRMLTKEQWKTVMKSAVRCIRTNPSKYSTDEAIKVLVQQYCIPYLKL